MKDEHAKTSGKHHVKSVFDMTDQEKKDTGVGGLTDQQKRNLDQWIDNNILAPGDPPHNQ